MKKINLLILLFIFSVIELYATPDRGVWVIDSLVGFTKNSYIIRQYVYDNMRSHYEGLVQVFLIEKDIKTHKVIKNIKITEYKETIDSITGEITRNNRSEDKIEEIIKKYPELFYDIYYAFPIGIPNNKYEKYLLENNEIILTCENNDDIKKYSIDEYFKIDVQANNIIQIYQYRNYRILLIEFGYPDYEANYYQKIVVIEK